MPAPLPSMMPMGKPPAMTLKGLAAEITKKMMKPTPKAPRFNSVELLIGKDTLIVLDLIV
nr:hypothetical protein GCM10020185_84340 [Pseudomonas brassicacearum subsp. brassicacearum]